MEKVTIIDLSEYTNKLSESQFKMTTEISDIIQKATKKQSHQAIMLYLYKNQSPNNKLTGNDLHKDLGISEANIIDALRALKKADIVRLHGFDIKHQVSLTAIGRFLAENETYFTISKDLATEDEIDKLINSNTIKAQILKHLANNKGIWINADSLTKFFDKGFDVISSSGDSLMYGGFIERRFYRSGYLQFRATEETIDYIDNHSLSNL